MRQISRREFLRYVGAGTAAIIGRSAIPFSVGKGPLQASTVVQCFDETATSENTVNESVVQIMMDESVKALTGMNDVGEAWKSLFPGITQNNVVSIKVNCINSLTPTNPELVNCIVNGLAQMELNGHHFKRNNIIIWDRTDSELRNAGYTVYDEDDPDTVRCFGTNHPGVGRDSDCRLDVDYSGGTYTKYPSMILSQMSDYLINAAVLKNHGDAIVPLGMKNHYGSVDQPPGGQLHYTTCNPSIPSLCQQLRDVVTPHEKERIVIIDALWGSVIRGPGGAPNCNPKKVIMSTDIVACDSQGQNIINEERTRLGYSTVNAPHITTAPEPPYNLGTTEIDLVEISNPTGIEESHITRLSNTALSVSPNPFRTQTTITLSVSHTSFVYLDLVDSSGRLQESVFQGQLPRGDHRLPYRTQKRLPSGTYFLRFHGHGSTHVSKVTVLN